jgi:hypothetical protein
MIANNGILIFHSKRAMYCVYTEWYRERNYLAGFIAVPARLVSSVVNTVLEIKFVKRLWIKQY